MHDFLSAFRLQIYFHGSLKATETDDATKEVLMWHIARYQLNSTFCSQDLTLVISTDNRKEKQTDQNYSLQHKGSQFT